MVETTDTYQFCPNCGQEASAGNTFCSNCGNPLAKASEQPSAGEQIHEQRDISSRSDGVPGASRPKKMTPIRWINAGSIAVVAIGVFMTWASFGPFSVTGINTDDGKLFGGLVIVTALLAFWYLARVSRIAAALLILAWVGQVAFAAYEIVNVSSARSEFFGSSIGLDVGTGLYFIGLASIAGVVTAAIDVCNTWALRSQHRPVWVLWLTGVVAVLAAVGAGIGGHDHSSSYGNSGSVSNTHPGSSGTSGNTGFGNSGATGSGNTGFGNSGSTGFGNTGTGNSGNS
jgi:hypothetical protein